MRYLGEEYPWLVKQAHDKTWRDNYAYLYILAHSGMAFGLRWKEGWHMDNADHMLAADPNEIIRRAFAAVGYTYEIVHKTGAPGDEALFREKIRTSLAAGRPVLAFGVVGPPECCLVTGCDEGGDVLLGWNFFQGLPPFNTGVEFEPTGQFRKRNWFPDTWSMLIIGEKTERPEVHGLNRDTLRWALQVARAPWVFDRATGHAAYEAWARQLANDVTFADQPEAVLREQHDAHHNVVGMLAECRWYGAQWLRYIAGDEPAMAEALLAAAACFEQEHELMWKVWGAVGGNGHPGAWAALARPEVRKEICSFILQARDLDIAAAGHLEQALLG